jgi:hypothetical protein
MMSNGILVYAGQLQSRQHIHLQVKHENTAVGIVTHHVNTFIANRKIDPTSSVRLHSFQLMNRSDLLST